MNSRISNHVLAAITYRHGFCFLLIGVILPRNLIRKFLALIRVPAKLIIKTTIEVATLVRVEICESSIAR